MRLSSKSAPLFCVIGLFFVMDHFSFHYFHGAKQAIARNFFVVKKKIISIIFRLR
jgi:hypothetical protein